MRQRSRTGRSDCGLCGVRVKSKDEHLKKVHGWVDCAYCFNSMGSSSLENHLKQKHNKEMLDLVTTVTRALEGKKDPAANAEKETQSKVCRDCNVVVDSMVKHLENVHGYIRCKVCNNQMPADSLDKHLKRSHGQDPLDNDTRNLKFQPNKDIDKLQNQTHESIVPKLLSSRPFEEISKPSATNPPSSIDLSNIYDLVAGKNGASLINAPQKSSTTNGEETYLNMILISDKELNKLMAEGRIGSQQGKLFMRDS